MTDRMAQLDALLEGYDPDTLGDDPAEFDEWLALHDEREDLRARMLLSGRCVHCETGEHHLCRGWGIDRCPCYCQDILEEENGGSPVD